MTTRLVLKDFPGNCTLSSVYPGFINEMKQTTTTVYKDGHIIGSIEFDGTKFIGFGNVQNVLDVIN